jgi:hypothetical protein
MAALSLAATLAMSAALVACSAPPTETVVVDKDHNDSHRWDDHENQAWHRFLTEKSRPAHEYTNSDKNEQSEYWNWRHSHPD